MGLACSLPGCGSPAVGRCELSWQPYCIDHIDFHSVTGNSHFYRVLRSEAPTPEALCPECGGPTKTMDGGELVACRARERCGWTALAA